MDGKFTVGKIALQRNKKCWICGTKQNLEPHHIIHVNCYDELYNSLDHIAVLCSECHHKYHQKYNGEITFKTLLDFKGDYEMGRCRKLKKKYGVLRDAYRNLKKVKRV